MDTEQRRGEAIFRTAYCIQNYGVFSKQFQDTKLFKCIPLIELFTAVGSSLPLTPAPFLLMAWVFLCQLSAKLRGQFTVAHDTIAPP
jgi:hypothetical protein